MNKTTTILQGTLLLLVGAAFGWGAHSLVAPAADAEADAEAYESDDAEAARISTLVRVSTVSATVGDLTVVKPVAGTVRIDTSADHPITSRASGRVLETHASEGQRVKQNEVLLRFDEQPLRAALAQSSSVLAQATNALAEFEGSGRENRARELESTLRRAEAQITLLEAQEARLEPLHRDGLVADRALEEARQAATQARADRALAEASVTAFAKNGAELQQATLVSTRDAASANVAEAQRILEEASVRAPCDGQVAEFTARVGASLAAGDVFARIFADDARIVVFGVGPDDLHDVLIGARATWEGTEHEFQAGNIVRISNAIDPASSLFDVFVAPAPDVHPALVGLHVLGEIEVQRIENALLVPETAILRSGDRQTVVIAEVGIAKVVPVEILGRHAGRVAIRGAVVAGAHVIVDGGYNLPDGAGIVETPR
ncbi:MAG: efflux RND transporter periplasmic adaptor subunit [Planctomycetota bacterium]|nr:efflux RND transporter periplasmic adaptor subunit [Planctomycetota bacterium]